MKYERKEKIMIDKILKKKELLSEPIKNDHLSSFKEAKFSKSVNDVKKNPFKIEKIIEEPFQEDNEVVIEKDLFYEACKNRQEMHM